MTMHELLEYHAIMRECQAGKDVIWRSVLTCHLDQIIELLEAHGYHHEKAPTHVFGFTTIIATRYHQYEML